MSSTRSSEYRRILASDTFWCKRLQNYVARCGDRIVKVHRISSDRNVAAAGIDLGAVGEVVCAGVERDAPTVESSSNRNARAGELTPPTIDFRARS